MAKSSFNNKNKPRVTPDMYGKIPPQARDIEMAVLGACMDGTRCFDKVVRIISAECFYVDTHQRIFRAMESLSKRMEMIDILTITDELRKTNELEMVGGPYYITILTNGVVSSANIETHSRIILQKFLQREIIRMTAELNAQAYLDSTDCFDLIDAAERDLFGLTGRYLKHGYKSVGQGLVEMMTKIDHLAALDEEFTGVPSGYTELDRITHGWQSTDLIILAARPAVGKTAFALNLARNAALHPIKPVAVGIFSLEMSFEQMVQRITAIETGVWLDKIRRARLEEKDRKLFGDHLKKLGNAPIFIDDTGALNIYELRSRAREMYSKHNVGLIIIDYLQLMSGVDDSDARNREQEISKISRDLKGLSKELKIPIIALSQLSRKVEDRKKGDRMPLLSDLRESGAIEQDADLVMFMYRPEYYDKPDDFSEEPGLTELKIAKHRNGDLGVVKLKAELHLQRFSDWSAQLSIPGLGAGTWRPVEEKEKGKDELPL